MYLQLSRIRRNLLLLLVHFLLLPHIVLSIKMPMLSLPPDFLAGGVAGTLSATLTMPLEVVKTQLQSSGAVKSSPVQVAKTIFKNDGFLGFYRGLSPMLIGIIPTRAIYFWGYSSSKESLKPVMGDSPLNHLGSAFFAGILSNTITNPIWMCKTRYQIMADTSAGQRLYSGYSEIIRSIWKEEGIRGFFKGLSASYVGCFEGAIQWIVYEKAKSILVEKNNKVKSSAESKNDKLRPLEYFLSAATAKFIAICATYPHEVARTRMREQAKFGAFKYGGFIRTIRTIAKEEGVKGLYGGLQIHLARSVPNAALMFLTFELASNWLQLKN